MNEKEELVSLCPSICPSAVDFYSSSLTIKLKRYGHL